MFEAYIHDDVHDIVLGNGYSLGGTIYHNIAGNIGEDSIWRFGPKRPLQRYWQILIWWFGTGSPYVYIQLRNFGGF